MNSEAFKLGRHCTAKTICADRVSLLSIVKNDIHRVNGYNTEAGGGIALIASKEACGLRAMLKPQVWRVLEQQPWAGKEASSAM